MSEKGGYNVNEKTDPTQNTIRLMDTAVNGLAKASVQTRNGLAIASIKTWNGLA